MSCGVDFSPLPRTKWNQHSLPRSRPKSHSPYPTSLQEEDLSFSHSFTLYPVPVTNSISLAPTPHTSQGRSNHHQIPHSELWGPQVGLKCAHQCPLPENSGHSSVLLPQWHVLALDVWAITSSLLWLHYRLGQVIAWLALCFTKATVLSLETAGTSHEETGRLGSSAQ